MTKSQRRILEQARDTIAAGHETYICCAINYDIGSPTDKDYLADHISDQLGPHAYLEDWQMRYGHYVSHEQTRQDRIAWINWMLGDLQ